MKMKFPALFSLLLLTGPVSAELVQSTTGAMGTSRDCVKGVTVCDSFGRQLASAVDGLPGAEEASASLDDPEHGKATGKVKLTGTPGGAEMHASSSSPAGKRNGGNSSFLQRYTNVSEHAETLTFGGTMTYNNNVPAENANFPDEFNKEAGTYDMSSSTSAEIVILTLNAEAIEAGTTADDNLGILLGEASPDDEPVMLHASRTKELENVTGTGTSELSGTVTIAPGDSVWLFAILQSLGANGAVNSGSLNTTTSITVNDE
jgi:hypothetical protein